MTLRQDLKAMLRPVVETAQPAADLRHLNATRAAIQGDAKVARQALAGVLPLATFAWWLPGTATVGNGQGQEVTLPQAATLRTIRVRCKTAPVGANLTVRLTKNGSEVDRVTVQNGQTSGASGESVSLSPGDVLRVDIVAVGSSSAGGDLTVQVDYLPVTG